MENFNPHEREARDAGHEGTAPLRAYFNPHEREARDLCGCFLDGDILSILIHTSVKLVTLLLIAFEHIFRILIHTSVKLVTKSGTWVHKKPPILIHTSVKLVTVRSVR